MLGAYEGDILIATNFVTAEAIETYKGMGFEIKPIPQSSFGDDDTKTFSFNLARHLGLWEEEVD